MSTSQELLKKLRIMLVEDDQFLRQVHSHVLKTITQEKVIIAENGREAMSLLYSHSVDIIITDIQMPDINGLELIKRIRCGTTQASPAMPIVVVSTFSNPDVLAACMELEINGFLVKPISGEVTVQKIQKALAEKPTLSNFALFKTVNTDLEVLKSATSSTEAAAQSEKRADEHTEGTLKEHQKKVTLAQLKPGMVLCSKIKTKDGRHLLEQGKPLTENYINRLQELHSVIDEEDIWIEV